MANAKMVDLLDFIEWSGVECLNQNTSKTWENALKQGYRDNEAVWLESDCDEQILLHIPFTQMVKLHSLHIAGPADGSAPKRVRIFVNRTSLGFSEAADEAATQDLELSEDDLSGTNPLALKFVKFQNVRSITVFLENNQDDEDTTKLSKLVLMGSTVETTNMKEFKAVG